MAHENSPTQSRLTFGLRVKVPDFASKTPDMPGFVIRGPDDDGDFMVALQSAALDGRGDTRYLKAEQIAIAAPEDETEEQIRYQQEQIAALQSERDELRRLEETLRNRIDDLIQGNEGALTVNRALCEQVDELTQQLADAKPAGFDLAQLRQAGLEVHSTLYMKALESKAMAYDTLCAKLVEQQDRDPKLPASVERMVLGIHEIVDERLDRYVYGEEKQAYQAISAIVNAILPHGIPHKARPPKPEFQLLPDTGDQDLTATVPAIAAE